mmetsp:Transcript_43197/g.134325  ORF Transcript_43197/g.134325 Transcript_43197/m.134325 type:complete len:183 (+) Transcript_43197:67-615(+)
MAKRSAAANKSVYSMEDVKRGFQRLDRDDDGFLSFTELREMLLRGNPEFSEKQLRLLWRGVDKDRDGNVEFDEFVDFIFGKPLRKRKDIWQDIFHAYSGSDEHLAEDEFMLLCTDSGLCDDSFSTDDAKCVFSKVKGPDDRVDSSGFSKAMTRIAKRKDMSKARVKAAVLACAGPKRNWDAF